MEFKRGVVQQLLKGEKTLAEVSRELHLQPSMVRQWKRHFEAGVTASTVLRRRIPRGRGRISRRSESVPRERGGRVEFEVATDHPPSASF